MSNREVWEEICASAKTPEELRCVGEGEENAFVSSEEEEGFGLHGDAFYATAIATYEFLIDCGEYAHLNSEK
ncbi:hypothetical protein ACFU44_00425 [Nocardia rhizosphaerihabitans]|uniref:hypothetical protein n=1 Tax=Nocardia rhizosphaerihabitans TaxID=1691570 RepID=UPI00366B107F